MIEKNQILEFVKKNGLCVLSTVSPDNRSESAVMALTVKDDFTLLMNTEPNTRKISNLQTNPSVSLIVGGFNNDPSVQIEGVAIVLEGSAADLAKNTMLAMHPELKDYLSPSGKFISVKPVWCRWSNFSQNPPEIYEITF